MLEKFNCLQVLISAEFIRHPLPVLFPVIQIQHGGNRIHTDAVNVELPYPEQHVGNEEILHLRLAVIENLGAPVRMLAQPWVWMLKDALPVKLAQPVGIRGKMCGHPVQNHTYACPVQLVYQIHEILRGSVPGRGRVITRHLVAPGAVEGMLRNAHQLHVGKLHFL